MNTPVLTTKRNTKWQLAVYALFQFPLIGIGIAARYVWEGLSLGWFCGGRIQADMEQRTP